MKSMSVHRSQISRWARIAAGVCVIAILIPWIIKTPTLVRLYTLNHGDSKSVPFALRQLQSSDESIRSAAAHGLGFIGPKAEAAVPHLIRALHDESPVVAAKAAWALGTIEIQSPRREVVDALIDALDHSDGEVRRYAAYAFSLFGRRASSAGPHLKRKLQDPNVAPLAARALGEMGSVGHDAIPELTALLSSSHSGQRAEASMALANLQPLPDETVAAIKKLLNDDQAVVRDVATRAIEKIRTTNQSATVPGAVSDRR